MTGLLQDPRHGIISAFGGQEDAVEPASGPDRIGDPPGDDIVLEWGDVLRLVQENPLAGEQLRRFSTERVLRALRARMKAVGLP